MDEIRIIPNIQKIPNVPNNQNIPNNPNVPNNQITHIIQNLAQRKRAAPIGTAPTLSIKELLNRKLNVDIDRKQLVNLLVAILHGNIMSMAAFAMAIIGTHSTIP